MKKWLKPWAKIDPEEHIIQIGFAKETKTNGEKSIALNSQAKSFYFKRELRWKQWITDPKTQIESSNPILNSENRSSIKTRIKSSHQQTPIWFLTIHNPKKKTHNSQTLICLKIPREKKQTNNSLPFQRHRSGKKGSSESEKPTPETGGFCRKSSNQNKNQQSSPQRCNLNAPKSKR